MAAGGGDIPVLCDEGTFNGVECYDLFEEIEHFVTFISARKIGESGITATEC